ncbi:hypothetical protein A9K71_06255 [Mesorhizobium sp. WSM3873]|nr:hypothetical protein A9K71_06255 [Mesorhizobium sp. WSM3873]
MARAIAEGDPELAPPLDQIFRMLQREYTPQRIEREVTSFLKTPRKADISKHDIVLRLSSDSAGAPFVVTTNFDLLFERAKHGLKSWLPPALPIMTGDQNHTGVVYLHGRLPAKPGADGRNNTLVLGSGDFGRAYLADGWATTFIRQLLERRVVVLLGYSAGDPPIRYLLEGLEASTSARLRTIYAFDRGEEDEVRAKWRDIGVTGISFGEFSDLWESLEQWASRADNQEKWKANTIALARRSPRDLMPFQRGQVVSLLSTSEGAKTFAAAIPPPSSEWLCVLDRSIRYSQPGKDGWEEDKPEIDPLEVYGLDDDPMRPDPSDWRAKVEAIDALGSLPADGDGPRYSRLSGIPNSQRGILPPRLQALASWFESVAHELPAIWWAARQSHLDPDLMWGVNRRLNGHGAKFDDGPRRAWLILREINLAAPDDIRDRSWFDLAAQLRQDRWTRSVLRALDEAVRPRLALDPPILRSPLPPLPGQSDDPVSMLRTKVEVPERHEAPGEIPADMIPAVFKVLRGALERAISLLEETPFAYYFHLPAIEPDEKPGERHLHHDGVDALFMWAVDILRRYLDISPLAAKRDVSSWPESDRFFFDKLKLFAWKNAVFTGSDVAAGVVGLSQQVFWDAYLQREMLQLLAARWPDFSIQERTAIETRTIKGRDRYKKEPADKFEQDAAEAAAVRLGWLDQHSCALSEPAQAFLEDQRKQPAYRRVWEEHAADDRDGRSGWVERRKDGSKLLNTPLDKILNSAASASGRDHEMFVEHVPFEGLVRERPFRALAALALESRRGKYPAQFWQQLLSDWPEGTSTRLLLLCGLHLSRLPQETVFELRFYLPDWIEKHLAPSALNHTAYFFDIWDAIFVKLNASGEEATQSSMGEVRVGGRIVKGSRKTLDYAINGPIGKLVDSLFDTFGDRKFAKDEQLPVNITERLDRALTAVGEGASHAACLLGRRLDWLFYVDPSWVRAVLLPLFKLAEPLSEAAWSGFLFKGETPQSAELFDLIKAEFLNLIDTRNDLLEEDELERQTAQILTIATYWHKHDARYLTNTQCRRALQAMSPSGRASALWTVSQIISQQDAWSSFGKQFFADIWPQEARYQTSSSSETMLRIAERNAERFPEVVQTIADYLRPVDHPDMFIFHQRREAGTDGERIPLVKRWPMQVLNVADRIIAREPAQIPHGLAGLLDDIAEHAPNARTTRSWRRLYELVTK